MMRDLDAREEWLADLAADYRAALPPAMYVACCTSGEPRIAVS